MVPSGDDDDDNGEDGVNVKQQQKYKKLGSKQGHCTQTWIADFVSKTVIIRSLDMAPGSEHFALFSFTNITSGTFWPTNYLHLKIITHCYFRKLLNVLSKNILSYLPIFFAFESYMIHLWDINPHTDGVWANFASYSPKIGLLPSIIPYNDMILKECDCSDGHN